MKCISVGEIARAAVERAAPPPTPDPLASPTPTIPPFASICKMPTVAPGTPAPGMAVCSGPESVHVGDTVQVAVEITGLERLDYISIDGFDMDETAGYFAAQARTGGHTTTPVYVGSHLRPSRSNRTATACFSFLPLCQPAR